MKVKVPKSGLDYSLHGLNSIRNNEKMRRLKEGTKIIDEKRTFPEYGTIIYHAKSSYTDDLYFVRWGGGIRTLFEVKKENLLN